MLAAELIIIFDSSGSMDDERNEMDMGFMKAIEYVRWKINPDTIHVEITETNERGASKIISVIHEHQWSISRSDVHHRRKILFLGDEGLLNGDPHRPDDTAAMENAAQEAGWNNVRVFTYLGTKYRASSQSDWDSNYRDYESLANRTTGRFFHANQRIHMLDLLCQVLIGEDFPGNHPNISARYKPVNETNWLPLRSSTSISVSTEDEVEFTAELDLYFDQAVYEWSSTVDNVTEIKSNEKVWTTKFSNPGFYQINLTVSNTTTVPIVRTFHIVVRDPANILTASYVPKDESQWISLSEGESILEGDKIKFSARMDPPLFEGQYYWTIKKKDEPISQTYTARGNDWEWEPSLLDKGEYTIECLASQIGYAYPVMQWSLTVNEPIILEPEFSFKLENVSEQIVLIKPGKSDSDALQVCLTTIEGEPVGGVPINWTIIDKNTPISVKGITNLDGISEFAISLKKTGILFPIVDGIPLTNVPIPAKEYIIQASVMEESLKSFVKDDPFGFFVKLELPTNIQFLSRSRGSFIDSVTQNDGFQMELTEDNPSRNAPDEITIILSSPYHPNEPVTLYRQSPSHLERAYYLSDRTIPASIFWDSSVSSYFINITASYKQENIFLPLYRTDVQFNLHRNLDALQMYEELLEEAKKSDKLDAATKDFIQTRIQGVRTGIYIIQHGNIFDPAKVMVGQRYLELLASEESTLGFSDPVPADPFRLSTWGNWGQRITFTNPDEAESVYLAIQQGNNIVTNNLFNIPSEINASVLQSIQEIPQMLVSPVFGAYTAITGLTMDGERATTFERVLGGGEALLTLLGGLVKLPPIKTRLARFGRFGRKYISDSLSETVDTIDDVTNVPTPRTYPREPPGVDLERFIRKNEESIQKHITDNISRQTRKRQSEQLLQQRINRWKSETDPSTRTSLGKAVGKTKNKLSGINNAILKSEGIIKRQTDRLLKNQQKLARLQRNNFSRNMVEQLAPDEIPKPRDRINGRSSQRNYEIQNEQELSGQGYIPGPKLTTELRTPYTHVHNTIDKFNPAKPPKRVRRPQPDHYNPQTFDVADSKYYDFDSLSPRELNLRATWINRTIEKYTVYQRYMIEALSEVPLTPDQITNLTLGSRIKIITPKTIPPVVMDRIRLLVGRPENFVRIEFIVKPAKPLDWFDYR